MTSNTCLKMPLVLAV